MQARTKARDIPLLALLLGPGMLVLTVVIVVPVFLIVQYSTVKATSFSGSAEFVGFSNFQEVLAGSDFWSGLWRTVVYAGGSVVLQVVIGIVVALLLNTKFRGNTFLRGASIVPYVVPTIVATVTWQWLLDPTNGLLNSFLKSVGLPAVQFLSPDLAMATAIGLSAWAWTPFVVIVFLSGLQTIPDELYESARVDGASAIRQFFSITLPMMRDIIVTIVILRGIWMFSKFDLINLLTGGGPIDRTKTLPMMIYELAFRQFDVGRGAAISVISLVIMLVGLMVFLRITRGEAEKGVVR